VPPLLPPYYTLSVSTSKDDDSLNTAGHVGGKSCFMAIDTVIARPDITAGLPERELTRLYVLQMISGETLPILMEVLVELTLGQHPLMTWAFVARIADEFILGLDIAQVHCASLDLGHCVLQLGKEEVLLWRPRA
jgi:hypothetical protein